ncbi:zinc-ribbon domain-containing protein [Acidianus sulfidivorans JP7]|uniref:Zinc-ribbon domain-containing protein n=1 Tax=Acidianus sulfidivorans JP7 TaxID=619593 RepID=A0A2U9IPY7_9CREN|nr:zinc ribbon domain-containing protein [Acidianus sulfidivorans]AWR98047.1 zinc-ribbon domain-containing protein [Acidianus sulfidivorans JP7]
MVKYCPRCGVQNPDDAKFCYNCGYQFPEILPTPQSPSSQPPLSNPPPRGPSSFKKFLPGLIGAIVAVIVVIAVVAFVLPHSTSAIAYSPSQASSTFGGTWHDNKNETASVTYSNGVYTVVYANGTTLKESYNQVISSIPTLQSDSNFEGFMSFTSAYVEVLNGTINGQSVSLVILKIQYPNSSIPTDIYEKVKSLTGIAIVFGANVQFGSSNGYKYIFIGPPTNTTQSSGSTITYSDNSEIIAEGGNTLIVIGTINLIASQSQLVSVLDSIT